MRISLADRAEQELVANTGSDVGKERTRCRGPKTNWRSIIPEQQPSAPRPLVAARWARAALENVRDSKGTIAISFVKDCLEGHEGALQDARCR